MPAHEVEMFLIFYVVTKNVYFFLFCIAGQTVICGVVQGQQQQSIFGSPPLLHFPTPQQQHPLSQPQVAFPPPHPQQAPLAMPPPPPPPPAGVQQQEPSTSAHDAGGNIAQPTTSAAGQQTVPTDGTNANSNLGAG
jgi:hypothetical protein